MWWNRNQKNNIAYLNQKYTNIRCLTQKDFHNLNSFVLTLLNEKNDQKYKDSKLLIAGTVLESGFFDWKYEFISNKWFKNSFSKFPYAKINKWVNKNQELKTRWKIKAFLRLSETKSLICFAGAGSGKTTGVVLPTILANALSPTRPNLLITDPKGELAKSTFNFLKMQGYKVKVLNILDTENTDCFSPFSVVKELIWKMLQLPIDSSQLDLETFNKKINIVNLIDSELKNVIFSLDSDKKTTIADFWNRRALVAIHNIAWLIIDDLAIEFNQFKTNNSQLEENKLTIEFNKIFLKFSFQSIFKTLAEFGTDGVKKYKEFYQIKYDIDIDNLSSNFIEEHKGLQQWQNLWREEKNNSTLSADIISNALMMLEKFNNPVLKNLTIFNTFDLDDIYGNKKEPIALFVTINNAKPETLNYISWFINYLLLKINSFASEGKRTKLDKPLMCILEGIGNIPFIKALPFTVNEGRGKNIFVSLFFQTSEQYYEKYGHEGGGFIRSCAYKMLLTNSEGRIVDELVQYAGTWKYVNKQTEKVQIRPRLTKDIVYSLPRFKALIFQNDINVPYIAGLIPFQLFGIKPLKRLNIKLEHDIIQNKDIIYNPLLNKKYWNMDDLIKYDFNWKEIIKVFKIDKNTINKLITEYQNLINLSQDELTKNKYQNYILKLKTFFNLNEFNKEEVEL